MQLQHYKCTAKKTKAIQSLSLIIIKFCYEYIETTIINNAINTFVLLFDMTFFTLSMIFLLIKH